MASSTWDPKKPHIAHGKGRGGRRQGRTPLGAGSAASERRPPANLIVSAKAWAPLIGCGLVAAIGMFTNLSYGLPLFYHPDEPLKLELMEGIPQGKLPADFRHPHFMLYFSVPFVLAGKLFGVPSHLAARAAVATLGVATVCLLCRVGSLLGGRTAGLAAALFYATAPLAVITAHDFKEDIPLAFWQTLQLLFLVRYLQEGGRPRDLYLSAFALGGAIGTKYTGLTASALQFGAGLLGPRSGRRWRALGIAVLAVGVTFLICTPASLLAPRSFLLDAGFEGQHAMFGHGVDQTAQGRTVAENVLRISGPSYLWSYHLRYSLLPGISAAGLLLTAIGVAVALARGGGAWRLVASGLVLFYVLLETLPLKPPPFAARYMVAVLPYAALLCGRAAALTLEGTFARRLLIALVAVATLGLNGAETMRQVRAMAPETRDTARGWIFQHVPPGSSLIVTGIPQYGPLRYKSRPPDFPYNFYIAPESTLTQLLQARLDKPAYLIVSSFWYQRFLDHPDFEPETHRFYRMLFDRYTPVATFSAPFRPLGFHNPAIQIFRLGEASPTSAPHGR